MSKEELNARFEKLKKIDSNSKTFIEGLLGSRSLATIATTPIKNKLGLEHYRNILCDSFSQLASFKDCRIRR